MRVKSISGKIVQITHLRLALWPQFWLAWRQRGRSGTVPVVLPKSQTVLQIPLREFYESYSFFCESRQGRREMAFFVSRLHANEILFDIGAFRGAYGAAAKAARGNDVSVHLFEPLPDNGRTIEAVAELNSFTDFVLVPKAVACGNSIEGVLNTNGQMLREGDVAPAMSRAEFPAISLDRYVEEVGIKPSLLKIDVEGFELEVLRSARNLLAAEKPRLWLELHPKFLAAQGHRWEEATDLLKSLGYKTIHFFEDYSTPERDLSFHVWCEG